MGLILRLIGRQKWIRFGVRDRFIKLFHNPQKSNSKQFRAKFYDLNYDGDFATYIDWNVFYYGAYCVEELDFMRDAVEEETDPVVIDIGANIGHHSLFASTVAKKVHSFEPFPSVSQKLSHKLATNSVQNVTLHKFGLGNTNQTLNYFPPTDTNTGTGTFVETEENVGASSIPLEIRNGDEFFASEGINQIDYVKIDVEGFEEQVLLGLKNQLNRTRPIVFFEWSAKSRHLTPHYKHLFPEGYEFFLFQHPKPKYLFFQKYGYRLYKPVQDDLRDTNRVAIPSEKVKKFRSKIIDDSKSGAQK